MRDLTKRDRDSNTGSRAVGSCLEGQPYTELNWSRRVCRRNIAAAVEATGRKKLIFAGISLEVCAAFPAITALGKGYDAYVAVDASGTFSETKRQAGLLRMQQAGVILSDYATLMVEILKDNASPLAGPVYGALDMPWATLVGQIVKAYVK